MNPNSFENLPLQTHLESPILPKNKAIPFVIYENNKFIIPKEAKNLLANLPYKNISIISLVGKYRTGKSFLLNRVLLNIQSSGFGVGPTFKACTKGIWIWSDPIMIKNKYCKEKFPCFLIDTEGLGAYDEEINHDSKIFLIAVLISSLFIYNSVGYIDENTINNLSFVLNLSKTIKLKNNSNEENEEELAEYFPSLLWLLRDFSLKLEDKDGNVITEKQYLENSLKEIKGNNEIIEEKNKVRNLIKTYFPERDCFTMVRPVEKESDLQIMQNLPDQRLRKEFLEQAQIFKNKVLQKTKPKMFMKKNVTGSILVDLVQSILNSINGGSIPVIENSWKYVIQNECIKQSDNIVKTFKEKIENYRNLNKNNKNYVKDVQEFTNNLFDNYLNSFKNNSMFDDDTKKDFIGKIKEKLENELKKFNKENEKIFEEKFNEEADNLIKKFSQNFEDIDKYSNNYFHFFNDMENYRDQIDNLTPDFPHKKEILFDKIMLLVRKFLDSQLKNNRSQSDKVILNYKNVIDKLQEKLKNSNEQLIQINYLNSQIANEKMKQKEYEDKILNLQNEKKISQDNYERKLSSIKSDYDDKLKELINLKNHNETELHMKEEQMELIKKNNDKLKLIHEQKVQYLENEIQNWKNKYNNIMNDLKNNKELFNSEILNLKTQNEILKSEKKRTESNEFLNQSMNDFVQYFKENIKTQNEENKNLFQKIIENQKRSDRNSDTNFIQNLNETTQKNNELNLKLNSTENKIKNLEEQITLLNKYKDIINHTKGLKCKSCLKNFTYENFQNHYLNCQLNSTINNNITLISGEFIPERLKLKILKGRLKQDELGKPYLEYIIDINYNNQNWRVTKKFNQFATLYKTLKSLFKGIVNLPQSSNIFININEFGYGSFHENKIQLLEKFIKDLSELEPINTSKPFIKFIEFDKFFDEDTEIINQQIENSRFENKMLFNNDFDEYNSSLLQSNLYKSQI